MEPIEYVRALRRRWVLIASTVGIAFAVAWVTTTVAPVGVGPATRSYQATSILLSTGRADLSAVGNLQTLADLVPIPDIAKRVAQDIKYQGDPTTLGHLVQAVGDRDTGLLKITATSTDPKMAKALADNFSVELLAFLKERAETTIAAQADTLTKALDALKSEMSKLDGKIGRTTPDTSLHDQLVAQRNAKLNTYQLLSNQLQQLSSGTAFTAGLLIIQDAVPQPATTASAFQAPRSRNSRLIFAGILGLLAGVALSLVVDRFDTRIRTKTAAEKDFGLPVLAEIPLIARRKWRRLLGFATRVGGARPTTLPNFPRMADSFRLLGAGLSLGLLGGRKNGKPGRGESESWWASGTGRGNGHSSGVAILITSPGPAEGKTTVVANLALTFAQVGKKVIVFSCDFRRPRIHQLFGVPNTDGLAQALRSSEAGPILNGYVKGTPIERIRVVPAGAVTESPAGLLSSERFREALKEAREQADVVLLDTPPILASADVMHLFPVVDAVLVVARARKTTQELAARTSELLRRLEAPAVGVALNAVTETAVPSSYYRYPIVASSASMGDSPD